MDPIDLSSSLARRPGQATAPRISPRLTKAALSEPRKRLLELMQDVNFGRIEGLAILDGDPVLDPPPRVVYKVKFRGKNGPRSELDVDNFQLKTEVIELFQQFDQLRDSIIDVLEIQYGLPFGMEVTA